MHKEKAFKPKKSDLIFTKLENTDYPKKYNPEFERQVEIVREYMTRYSNLLEKLTK